MNNRKNIVILIILLIILGALAIFLSSKVIENNNLNSTLSSDGSDEMKVCIADVKQCPDGSFVSRDPDKNCEFRQCP
jgi:hypothetical protein